MVSKQSYAIACIELFGRLWADLDALLRPDEQVPPVRPHPRTPEFTEILRLEIDLVIGACDTVRWRSLLNTSQRIILKSTLQDVLLAFSACAEGISTEAVVMAQNQLFDAVQDQCAASQLVPELERMRRVAS